MLTDWLGNPITTNDSATQKGIDDFVEGILAYETKAVNVLGVADNDPQSCLANAYAAILHMFAESPAGPPAALPYLEKAENAARNATRREQMNVAAIRAWYDDDVPKAVRIANEIIDEFPRDLAMLKLAQTHNFNLGNAPGMLVLAEKAEASASDICYMHGMSAFAFEQCHLLGEAETAARHAIDMKHKEPWAQHALAHVMITQGRIEEGRLFLEDASRTWTDLNSFMVTHNWWHLALNYISLGRFDQALSTYDNEVWGVWKEYSQDQINAVSLLLRMELAGVDVADRWQDVGDYLKLRTGDFIQPFLTMHYIYGLARAGLDEADTLHENLLQFSAPDYVQAAWQEVALPACEGLLAHARGNFDQAVENLSRAIGRLSEIGGSHAQRDLFEQVLLDATIKTGNYALAQQKLEMRRSFEPDSVPTNLALAAVYEKLGLPREAEKARARLGAVCM